MPHRKGDLSKTFKHSQDNGNGNNSGKEVIKSPVPDMIRDDQPKPRPRPPVLGQNVDAKLFNQRWQQQVDKHRQSDAFDKVDANKALTQHFNERSGVENAHPPPEGKEKIRDSFDQVDSKSGLTPTFNRHTNGPTR